MGNFKWGKGKKERRKEGKKERRKEGKKERRKEEGKKTKKNKKKQKKQKQKVSPQELGVRLEKVRGTVDLDDGDTISVSLTSPPPLL